MDLIPPPTGSADPVAEVRRLRRELRRERARRQAAESVEARAGADLYDSVLEMRVGPGRPARPSRPARGRQRAAHGAAPRTSTSGQLVNRAAESVGRAIGVDRCDVLPVDARAYSGGSGHLERDRRRWRGCRAPSSFVDLPEPLTTLLIEAAQQREPLQIDHVDEDPRLGVTRPAARSLEALGVRALAAVPVAMGDEVVGWMIVQSRGAPSLGAARARDLCRALARPGRRR